MNILEAKTIVDCQLLTLFQLIFVPPTCVDQNRYNKLKTTVHPSQYHLLNVNYIYPQYIYSENTLHRRLHQNITYFVRLQ